MFKYEKFLSDLKAFVLRELADSPVADACASALITCFEINFRYQNIYIPTQSHRNKEIIERNAAILKEFNGHNHGDLAVKYRLSTQSIYTIIKELRKKTADDKKHPKPIIQYVIEELLPHEFIMAGLGESEAETLSQKVFLYLTEKYSGMIFRIHEKINPNNIK